jgi:hypothetical protein
MAGTSRAIPIAVDQLDSRHYAVQNDDALYKAAHTLRS